MLITKKDIDAEKHELEDGIYVFFATSIKNLREKLTDLVYKRTVPFGNNRKLELTSEGQRLVDAYKSKNNK